MAPQARMREIRVDFFRGLAMFIIFIAHMPWNPWTQYIPARFGPSDATEMFVFCSGFASAIAFGGVFARAGFGIGCVRIAFRCWQIYWCHIGLFLAVLAVTILGTEWGARDYLVRLNLYPFLDETQEGIIGLLTLTYVPNLFDILPMYFVVLLLVPVVMLLARINLLLVGVFCFGLYWYNWFFGIDLPAEWWSDRSWYFNPFGWQLIFFTGFAFGAGWLRPPPLDRRLIWVAAAIVLVLIPLYYGPIWKNVDWIRTISDATVWGRVKTDFGILRYVHFLSLAYLAYCLFNQGREEVLRHRGLSAIVKVGQQALPTFLASLWAARAIGMTLDTVGRTPLTVTLANFAGFALIIAVAYLAAYFKSAPWKRPPQQSHQGAKANAKTAPGAPPSSQPSLQPPSTHPLGRPAAGE
jgi:hypothetical protein